MAMLKVFTRFVSGSLVSLVVLSGIVAGPAPVFGATISSTFFGMHSGFGTPTWPSSISVGSLGKGSCVAWEYIESSRGVRDWSGLDAKVASAAAHGVDLFYSSDSVPGWAVADQTTCIANGCGFGAKNCNKIPDNLTDVDNFYGALAQRYCGSAFKYIELWNEPWIANAGAGAIISPSDMATITTHIYNAVRANCPSMKIIAPDMDGNDVSYASSYFAAGAPTGVDIAAVHAYPNSNGSASADAPEAVYGPDDRYLWPVALQKDFNTYLPGKPIWDTEGSWDYNTGVGANSDATRAAFVSRWYILQASNGFDRVYWYAWDEPNWGTLSPALNPPGSSVPAIAYQQTYNWLVGKTMALNACQHGTGVVWTCPLTGPNNYQALAVWNISGPSSYTPSTVYSQYRDLAGNTVAFFTPGSPVTIGIKPILLENVAASTGPVAWWKFDETSGTIASDSSGNNNTGTLINGPVFVSGRINNALSLDGINEFVDAANPTSLQITGRLTVSAWINTKTGDGVPVSKYNFSNNTRSWRLYVTPTNILAFTVSSDGVAAQDLQSPTSISLNTWQYITATYDGARITLYINGTSVASTPYTAGLFNSSAHVIVGDNANGGNPFNGQIDDVRIYNRALSATEVSALYNGAPTPPSVPTNLSGTAVSSSRINLTWTASTDNVAVTGYKVYRNGTQVGASATNSYSDTSLAASTVYGYTVSAYDAALNNSAQSASIGIITLGSPAPTITIGSRVTTTTNLNVRASPSASATKIGTEVVSSPGTVVGGPTTAGGHTWWEINYDNAINGWSIGDYLVPVATASSPPVG